MTVRTFAIVLGLVCLSLAASCDRGEQTSPEGAAPESATPDSAAGQAEANSGSNEPASLPTETHADHALGQEGQHPTAHSDGTGEHAGHVEHDSMAHVLAEGEYNPAALVAQPGANMGDITRCPVSGEVFEVTEDSPYATIGDQPVYVCCARCVRRLQRNPAEYL